MTNYVTVFDRVHFDASGEAVKWERSLDGCTWTEIDWLDGQLPFILINHVGLQCYVVTETRQTAFNA